MNPLIPYRCVMVLVLSLLDKIQNENSRTELQNELVINNFSVIFLRTIFGES